MASPAKPVRLGGAAGFISFSFDDFPASALGVGGAILERYGARGTFYLSAGLMGAGSGPADGDVRAVPARGHELGCHTFSHLDCAQAGPSAVDADVARNAAAVGALVPGLALRHFAYPFGAVDRPARRVAARRFATARSIYGGVNRGPVDAALLKANRLYGPDGVYRQAMTLIDDVARHGGWLILFTHDVSDRPGPFGSHAAAFEHVVRKAVESGCTVAPVGAVAGAALTPAPEAA